MAEIRLENVAHSYDGGSTFALNPISLTWKDGNAVALLGPSGCGKTTLLNIISGLLTPSVGRVYFDGVDVTDLDTAKRNVAQVFQFPVLYDTMTVRQNLAFPLKNRNVAKDVIAARVEEIAELLGISKYLDIRPLKLRSDLQQLVSLGRGLVRKDVPAILFDEPLTVIDQNFKWTLRGRLKEMHNNTRHTLVYVTHDQTEALTFADEVVVLNQGNIVQTGTASDLFLTPQDEFVGFFIGSPGMNFLDGKVNDGAVMVGSTRIGTTHSATTIANDFGVLGDGKSVVFNTGYGDGSYDVFFQVGNELGDILSPAEIREEGGLPRGSVIKAIVIDFLKEIDVIRE